MIPEICLLLHNATVVTGKSVRTGTVAVSGERISGVWYPDEDGMVVFEGREIPFSRLPSEFAGTYPGAEVSDLTGKMLLAGGIDAHVHFREPGMTSKADMSTESLAAIMGGVTSFIDMPNTNPPTITGERIKEKLDMASGRSYANYGFHLGATNNNLTEIQNADPENFGAVKVFMGSSTGNMLVDDDSALGSIFRMEGKRIFVHCEDEKTIRENLLAAQEKYGDGIPFRDHENIRSRKACIKSSVKALEMAMKYGTKLHILHISTAEEVEMVRAAKQINPEITAETSANYLWFCDSDYETLGSRIKCNPSIKTANDRDALRAALANGIIDTIGSDHAPHLPSEKQRPYMTAPSGIPSVQQSLPVLITVASQEGIPMNRIASVFSERIAQMLGIRDRGFIKKGYYADIVIVDPEKEFTVKPDDLKYKCGWTPYEGARLKGYVETVFLSGSKVISDGILKNDAPSGQKLDFKK